MSTKKRETAPADLTNLTPAEVDTFLAEATAAHARLSSSLDYTLDSMHRYVRDERERTSGWGQGPWKMTTDQVVEACERMAAEGGHRASYLDTWEQGQAGLRALEEEIGRLNEEFERRGGWSRFYLVTNPGGHIHSSMNCSTCNKYTSRGQSQTRFAWVTDLSGHSEEEAVEAQGAILCTVCFPSAPVEWTNKYEVEKAARAAERCEGSGEYFNADLPHRTGYAYGNWATCSHCEARPSLTSTGKIKAHKPGKTSMR